MFLCNWRAINILTHPWNDLPLCRFFIYDDDDDDDDDADDDDDDELGGEAEWLYNNVDRTHKNHLKSSCVEK